MSGAAAGRPWKPFWRRRVLFPLAAAALALLLASLAAEALLRLVPLPGIQFNVATPDYRMGRKMYPGAYLRLRDENGRWFRREVNSWGMLDREHSLKKERDDLRRIGFFGDSYTEARQVPLDSTFFRIIERDLGPERVECIAFGLLGFSMVQSYLNCRAWAEPADLDLVVYVFCENDLADQIRAIKRNPFLPYVELTEDGFRVDDSFRDRIRRRQRLRYRVMDYLSARSMLIATLSERIRLLKQYGIKMRVTEEDRMMVAPAAGDDDLGSPHVMAFPSTWPDSLREHALRLGAAVITRWRDEVVSSGREFAILYVPRPTELEKPTAEQDSWKPWLEELCGELGIPFVDPTAELTAVQVGGRRVYYDHFTEAGHRACARAFVRWFRERYRDGA